MKKFSSKYFENKYKILANKLLIKSGFKNDIKEIRKKLGIPDIGFSSEIEIACFFADQMNKEDFDRIIFTAFMEEYAIKHNLSLSEKNKKQIIDAYIEEAIKEKNKEKMATKAIAWLSGNIANHNKMMIEAPFFEKNKFLSSMRQEIHNLTNKFWDYDLLDEPTMIHLTEKYLLLGDYGIDKYIEGKISCPRCKYIGITHFSPTRHNMNNEDMGSKDYKFNKETVNFLSSQFNSVFLIIKPYVSKKEVIEYIKDNWDSTKDHLIEKNIFYKQFDVKPSKIKKSNFERNKLIYELYNLPKRELLKKYKGDRNLEIDNIYKEMIVSEILKEEHGIEMSSDTVKKTATRFAKSISTKKKARDPEDFVDI